MNFKEAKGHKQQLEELVNICSERLKAFDEFKNEIGLTPDHIRATTEWQQAKQKFEYAFSELRNFNRWYIKTFKKEIREERKQRYITK